MLDTTWCWRWAIGPRRTGPRRPRPQRFLVVRFRQGRSAAVKSLASDRIGGEPKDRPVTPATSPPLPGVGDRPDDADSGLPGDAGGGRRSGSCFITHPKLCLGRQFSSSASGPHAGCAESALAETEKVRSNRAGAGANNGYHSRSPCSLCSARLCLCGENQFSTAENWPRPGRTPACRTKGLAAVGHQDECGRAVRSRARMVVAGRSAIRSDHRPRRKIRDAKGCTSVASRKDP